MDSEILKIVFSVQLSKRQNFITAILLVSKIKRIQIQNFSTIIVKFKWKKDANVKKTWEKIYWFKLNNTKGNYSVSTKELMQRDKEYFSTWFDEIILDPISEITENYVKFEIWNGGDRQKHSRSRSGSESRSHRLQVVSVSSLGSSVIWPSNLAGCCLYDLSSRKFSLLRWW